MTSNNPILYIYIFAINCVRKRKLRFPDLKICAIFFFLIQTQKYLSFGHVYKPLWTYFELPLIEKSIVYKFKSVKGMLKMWPSFDKNNYFTKNDDATDLLLFCSWTDCTSCYIVGYSRCWLFWGSSCSMVWDAGCLTVPDVHSSFPVDVSEIKQYIFMLRL